MNTTHKTAGVLAALLFALAVAIPTAGAATLSRPPQSRGVHFNWYRWHPTASTLHRRYGSKVVIGVESMQDLKALRVEYGFQHVQTIPALHALEVPVNRAQVHTLLTRGAQDTRIRYVSAIHTMKPMSMPNDPYLSTIDSTTELPYEWAFSATHVDTALQYTQGNPKIDVGIIDSGVSYVPDLAGKIDSLWTVDGTTISQDFTSNDHYGHGTAVASLIAANVDDGFGMAGFGGAAHIIAVDAMPTGVLSDDAIAVALNKLVSLGVRIVNMSLGGPVPSDPVLVDAIHRAAAQGVLLVAAAGNIERPGDPTYVSWPAADLQPSNGGRGYGLVVGASNADNERTDFSHWGKHLSLMAPGASDKRDTGVLVALPNYLTQIDALGQPTWWTDQGDHYGYVAGTSFSSPEVAGIAALIWAARPDLTNDQVADILKQSASRTSPDWTPEMGCGIVDAGAALELAMSRPASAWAQTPDTDGAMCSAFGDAKPTWPTDQTITFPRLANRQLGDGEFTPQATSSSGLPVSFSASGACSMDGTKVHLDGIGWCAVKASQDGDETYNLAKPVKRIFHITNARKVKHTHSKV